MTTAKAYQLAKDWNNAMRTVVYEHEISAKTKAMFDKFAHEASRVQWTAGRLAVLRDKGTKEEVASAEAQYAELLKPGVAEAEDQAADLRDVELENWERGQNGPSEPMERNQDAKRCLRVRGWNPCDFR